MATEKHDPKEIVTSDKKISRRSLLRKAAIGAPIALTLAHKPAFGAICSISGFQSINPSGTTQSIVSNCGGYSPGGWGQNGYKTGNQDGNRHQWLAAGFRPNPRPGYDGSTASNNDGAGTLFCAKEAFGMSSSYCNIADDETLHDVLLKHGTLESHAVANLLNAKYFTSYRLQAVDVVGLYYAYTRGDAEYTTSKGTVVDLNNVGLNGGLQAFFDQYPPDSL